MITFRPAHSDDLLQLIALLKVLFSIEDDFNFNEAKQRKGLQQMIDNKQGCIVVAETNDRVIGMCSGQITISTAEGGPALLVEDLIVLKAWQSQGVGKQLMNEIEKWAEQIGITRLQLFADKNNLNAL